MSLFGWLGLSDYMNPCSVTGLRERGSKQGVDGVAGWKKGALSHTRWPLSSKGRTESWCRLRTPETHKTDQRSVLWTHHNPCKPFCLTLSFYKPTSVHFCSTQQALFQTLHQSNQARLLTTSYQGVQDYISLLSEELREVLTRNKFNS